MKKLIPAALLATMSLASYGVTINCDAEENQYISSGEVTVEIKGSKAKLRSQFDHYIINRDNCDVRVPRNAPYAYDVTCPSIPGDDRIIFLKLSGPFRSYIADNKTGMYMASLVCHH